MGTDIQLWLKEHADSLVLDGETICWVNDLHAHLDRCRETGENPFPDAQSAEEILAEARALYLDGSPDA
jgi:hypothetical protein